MKDTDWLQRTYLWVLVVGGIIAIIGTIGATVQALACSRFGMFCSMERLANLSPSVSSPTNSLGNSGFPVDIITFVRERSLFTCQTVGFVSADGSRPKNEFETAQLSHCRDFGFETYADGGGPQYRAFSRSRSGKFAYDYDSRWLNSGTAGQRYGDLRLFFVRDSKLVNASLRIRCQMGKTEKGVERYPDLQEIELSAPYSVTFRVNNWCDRIIANGHMVFLTLPQPDEFPQRILPYIRVDLTSEYNISGVHTSVDGHFNTETPK